MLNLTLVTPDKKMLTGAEVEEIIVPAYKGQLDILPGHAPLMTTLSAGVLKVRMKGESTFKTAAISWGYLQVNPNGVMILAETSEWAEEVDKIRAEGNYALAEKRLQEAGLGPDDYVSIQRKVEKEKARLELVQ
jgi:F-type H+-transporting ATPase subunit epsilon